MLRSEQLERVRVADTADVSGEAELGEGTTVWHLAQVRERATLGRHCVVGRGAYVGVGVTIGDHCKLQNYALVYEPAVLASGVFVGPGAVLTNDQFPRAVTPQGVGKGAADWEAVGVVVGHGASIGARAVCVAPVRIGDWALVAAGAVVVSDVPAYALVVGVPSRQLGWVGRSGRRLTPLGGGRWSCPETSETYQEQDHVLRLVDSPTVLEDRGAGVRHG
jgi:acetyltransferase-like isoleucine patch superfamily enzyme